MLINVSFHSKCEKCQCVFGTERGLESHHTRNKGKACGLYASLLRRQEKRKDLNRLRTNISQTKFSSLGQLQTLAAKRKRSKGSPLTGKEKEQILRIFDCNADNGLEDSKVKYFHTIYFATQFHISKCDNYSKRVLHVFSWMSGCEAP